MEESQEKKFDWNTIWKWLKNPTAIAIILGLLFFVTLAMPLFEAHAVTVNVTASGVEIFETPDTDKYNVFANLLFRGFSNWPILALYILGVIGLALSAFGLKWRKCLMVSALLYMVTGVMFLISNEIFNLGEAWIDLASLGFADYVYDYIAVCDASLNAGSVIAAIMCFLTAIVAFKAASLTDEFTISDMTEMAVLSALGIALQFIKIPVGATGGSINLGLIPLFLLAMRQGPVKGFIGASLVYGLITCITDGWGFYLYPLDYLVAYGGICVLGFFQKYYFPENEKGWSWQGFLFITIGVIIATLIRFIGSGTSSMVNYGYDFIGAVIYNGIYIPVTGAVSLAVLLALYVPLAMLNKAYSRRKR